MKCIRCGRDSRERERKQGRCPGCGGEFALDPNHGDPFNDAGFAGAIAAVSGDGRLKWRPLDLYYELCRRRRRRGLPSTAAGAAIGLGVGAGTMAAWLWSSWPIHPIFAVVLAAGGGIAATAAHRRRRARRPFADLALEPARFEEMWRRWRRVHGTPEGLIVRRAAPRRSRPREPDLADYSFDRAVICDRSETVDLLLANNFHFENNCAVLSVDGYPSEPFETVRAMLKQNPQLHAFALHDASPEGCRLA